MKRGNPLNPFITHTTAKFSVCKPQFKELRISIIYSLTNGLVLGKDNEGNQGREGKQQPEEMRPTCAATIILLHLFFAPHRDHTASLARLCRVDYLLVSISLPNLIPKLKIILKF